ncbi:MAG TPA: hypothetical protein VGH27_11405 [Streptosporangiaceae bacterium]|jgi:hypothetical protein
MRTRMLLGTAVVTALFTAAPLTAASASSIDVLTLGRTAGPNATVGDTVTARMQVGTEATFYVPGSTTGVICKQASTTSTITANPSKPGVAGESLNGQSFSRCKTNIPGITLEGIQITGLPYTVTVSGKSGHAVTVENASTTTTFGTPAGDIPCSYTDAAVNGVASNTDSLITFTNQEFVLTPTSSTSCPPAADFSATFGPQKDVTVSPAMRVKVN